MLLPKHNNYVAHFMSEYFDKTYIYVHTKQSHIMYYPLTFQHGLQVTTKYTYFVQLEVLRDQRIKLNHAVYISE